MSALEIIQLLNSLSAVAGAVTGLVRDARDTLSSEDKALVESRLSALQVQMETDYQRARAALQAASET